MKNVIFKLAILSTCSWLVVASGATTGGGGGSTGGGGSGGGGTVIVGGATGGGNNETYELLSSTANKTSYLTGVAELSNNNNAGLKLATIIGELKHKSGALSLNNGDYTLNDTDGPNSGGSLTDGNSSLTFKNNFKGEYKYTKTYQQTFKSGANIVNVSGILGISTGEADIKRSQNAIFKGEVEAVLTTSTKGLDLYSDKLVLNADFSTSKVDISIDNFKAKDQITGQDVDAPLYRLGITDMKISGNGFSGGTLKTFKAPASSHGGTVPNKLVGTNESISVAGKFFGWLDNSTQPQEVGGQFLIQGDDGSLSGTFIGK